MLDLEIMNNYGDTEYLRVAPTLYTHLTHSLQFAKYVSLSSLSPYVSHHFTYEIWIFNIALDDRRTIIQQIADTVKQEYTPPSG